MTNKWLKLKRVVIIAEVVMVHVSSERRIKEFNKIASQIKLPYEGKIRKGYSQPFPYKGEIWLYKMKKQVVPQFLEFVNSNTSQIDKSPRPLQSAVNVAVHLMSFMSRLRNSWDRFVKKAKGQKPSREQHLIETVDMRKVKKNPQVVDGWGYSKVIGVIPDIINKEGEEEL